MFSVPSMRWIPVQRLLLSAVLAVTLVSAGVCADEPGRSTRETSSSLKLPARSNPETGPSRKGQTGHGGLWTTVVALVVIVGSLGAVGYWMKPYLGGARSLPIEAVELLGRRALEQKVSIHLVRCGGRILILSVSPDGARTLSEIVDPAEVRQLVEACQSPHGAGASPSQMQSLRDAKLSMDQSRASFAPMEDSRRA